MQCIFEILGAYFEKLGAFLVLVNFSYNFGKKITPAFRNNRNGRQKRYPRVEHKTIWLEI